MKKTIIVYYPKSQYHLVDVLIGKMHQKGIEIDGFNIPRLVFHSGKELPKGIRFFGRIPYNRLTTFVLRTFFFTYIIKSITKDYDVIDVHSFTKNYVPFLKQCNKPYKLTVWGSDFYREKKYLEEKRELYKKASIIQVETKTVKEDLITFEPALKDKVYVCNFGVDILNEIDELRNQNDMSLLQKEGKIVITCGYNGSLSQQHIKIFSAISKLGAETKEKILLCIPVTYGLSTSYKEILMNHLQSLKIPFIFLENRLSDKDLAKLRLDTDIAINIQTTDSLSSSLIQHLYAGSILIAGDWLPYDIFDDNSLVYYPVKEDELTNKLEGIINNVSFFKNQVKDNYLNVRKFATWEAVEEKQANIYHKVLHMCSSN